MSLAESAIRFQILKCIKKCQPRQCEPRIKIKSTVTVETDTIGPLQYTTLYLKLQIMNNFTKELTLSAVYTHFELFFSFGQSSVPSHTWPSLFGSINSSTFESYTLVSCIQTVADCSHIGEKGIGDARSLVFYTPRVNSHSSHTWRERWCAVRKGIQIMIDEFLRLLSFCKTELLQLQPTATI